MKLTWEDNSSNEDNFFIEKKREDDWKWWLRAVLQADTTEYNLPAEKNITYYFRIRAENKEWYSDWSNVAEVNTAPQKPKAPTGLRAEVLSDNKVKLTWDDNSFNEIRFERKTEGGTFSEIENTGENVTQFQDEGLLPNTKYYYRVRAYNAMGNSPYSQVKEVTTLSPPPNAPEAPSDLSASTVSPTQVNLAWTDNSNSESGFKIERKTGGGNYTPVTSTGANTTTYADTGLSPATTYTYRVLAYNNSGDSGYSNKASATTSAGENNISQPVTELNFYTDSLEYYVKKPAGTETLVKSMDASPVIREGRTLLPIKYVAQPLGASMHWDAAQQRLGINLGEKEITVWINNCTAKVDGQDTQIDPVNAKATPVIEPPGRTMLPLRFIAENPGCTVQWDTATRCVTVLY